jgi:hypothetical protein
MGADDLDPVRPLYDRALRGNLESHPSGDRNQFVVVNALGVTLRMYYASPRALQCGYDATAGRWDEGAPGLELPGNAVPIVVDEVRDHSHFVLRLNATGAFAAVVAKSGEQTAALRIGPSHLFEPGELGPIPAWKKERPIPPDSPRVLVGVGVLANGNTVTREQFWRLAPDSYTLAPGEKVTDSLTLVSGMETTSSREATIEAALDMSVSGGWGPVSAALSASLSTSSTTFQQVTVNQQTTNFKSIERDNTGDEVVTWLVWQLTEVLTISDPTGAVLASIVSAMQPPVLRPGGPPPGEPPSQPSRRRHMSDDERAAAPGAARPIST